MRIGIAADHGGFQLKQAIKKALLDSQKHKLKDFGAESLNDKDDYPDFVLPLARAVAKGDIERGIAVCGSGVGASVAANKISGIRAALIHDTFSAHQGVEDDKMNIICMGGRVIGAELALEIVRAFLNARFTGATRHQRRLSKIKRIEAKR